mmetsp:Transcript_3679/g.15267  ORF Transcript_3679/g.15267 Transcript_3679/m.15267 type:complete len:730 (-) Transcript_3679:3636-5825(-)
MGVLLLLRGVGLERGGKFAASRGKHLKRLRGGLGHRVALAARGLVAGNFCQACRNVLGPSARGEGSRSNAVDRSLELPEHPRDALGAGLRRVERCLALLGGRVQGGAEGGGSRLGASDALAQQVLERLHAVAEQAAHAVELRVQHAVLGAQLAELARDDRRVDAEHRPRVLGVAVQPCGRVRLGALLRGPLPRCLAVEGRERAGHVLLLGVERPLPLLHAGGHPAAGVDRVGGGQAEARGRQLRQAPREHDGVADEVGGQKLVEGGLAGELLGCGHGLHGSPGAGGAKRADHGGKGAAAGCGLGGRLRLHAAARRSGAPDGRDGPGGRSLQLQEGGSRCGARDCRSCVRRGCLAGRVGGRCCRLGRRVGGSLAGPGLVACPARHGGLAQGVAEALLGNVGQDASLVHVQGGRGPAGLAFALAGHVHEEGSGQPQRQRAEGALRLLGVGHRGARVRAASGAGAKQVGACERGSGLAGDAGSEALEGGEEGREVVHHAAATVRRQNDAVAFAVGLREVVGGRAVVRPGVEGAGVLAKGRGGRGEAPAKPPGGAGGLQQRREDGLGRHALGGVGGRLAVERLVHGGHGAAGRLLVLDSGNLGVVLGLAGPRVGREPQRGHQAACSGRVGEGRGRLRRQGQPGNRGSGVQAQACERAVEANQQTGNATAGRASRGSDVGGHPAHQRAACFLVRHVRRAWGTLRGLCSGHRCHHCVHRRHGVLRLRLVRRSSAA